MKTSQFVLGAGKRKTQVVNKSKVVLSDSPEAATVVKCSYVNQNGATVEFEMWRDVKGYVYNTEEQARYSSKTHTVCKCGELTVYSSGKCHTCINKDREEAFYRLKAVEIPDDCLFLYSERKDDYVQVDSLHDWVEEEWGDLDEDPQFLICEPSYPRLIDAYDYLYDQLPDGEDLPDNIGKAVEVFNAAIKDTVLGWETTNKRVDWEALKREYDFTVDNEP